MPIALAEEMVQLKGGIATLVFDVFSPGGAGRLTLVILKKASASFRTQISPNRSTLPGETHVKEIAKNNNGGGNFP